MIASTFFISFVWVCRGTAPKHVERPFSSGGANASLGEFLTDEHPANKGVDRCEKIFWSIGIPFMHARGLLRFDQRARFHAAVFGKIQMKCFPRGDE
jgi:hypothetical protein